MSKLAELTNVSSDNPVGNVHGKRNMVFAVVSHTKEKSKEMVFFFTFVVLYVRLPNLNASYIKKIIFFQSLKRKNSNDLPVIASKKLKFSPPKNKRQGSLFEKLKMVD